MRPAKRRQSIAHRREMLVNASCGELMRRLPGCGAAPWITSGNWILILSKGFAHTRTSERKCELTNLPVGARAPPVGLHYAAQRLSARLQRLLPHYQRPDLAGDLCQFTGGTRSKHISHVAAQCARIEGLPCMHHSWHPVPGSLTVGALLLLIVTSCFVQA